MSLLNPASRHPPLYRPEGLLDTLADYIQNKSGAAELRQQNLEEERRRQEEYQRRVEADLVGVEPYSLFFGRGTEDPSVGFQFAPADFWPGAGALKAGILGFLPLAAGIAKKMPRVKSGKTKGQYVGGPRGVDTPQKFNKMLKDYEQLVELGKEGRYFYEDSSNFFLNATGGNVEEATKLARSSAVYSQRMGVDPNLGHAIKAHSEAMLGDDLTAGGFPATQRPVVEEIYRGGDPDLGPKRGPYSQNLQVAWDPTLHANPVNDIWQGRAFGYTDPKGGPWSSGFTGPQHEFMNRVTTERLNPKFNQQRLGGYDDWNNLRTQAGAWSGEQLRTGYIKPGQEGYNYATFEPKYRGLLTRETMPGSTTAHMQEMLASPQLRQDFHDQMMEILIDPETGKDKIARAFHLLTPEDPVQARGFYVNPAGQVELNPAYSVPFLAGRKKVESEFGQLVSTIDPATKALVNASESTYSQLTAQNAYGWNYVMASDKISQPHVTSAVVDIGRQATDDELLKVYGKLEAEFGWEAIPIPNDRGFNILFFGKPEASTITKNGSYRGSKFMDKSGKITDEFFEEIGAEGAQVSYAKADTGFAENNWASEKYGQSYLQNADIRGRPSLRSAYDDVVPEIASKINALERRFAKENNLTLNKDIQKMRDALAQGGIKGLEKLIKTGTLPVVLVASFNYELNFSEPDA